MVDTLSKTFQFHANVRIRRQLLIFSLLRLELISHVCLLIETGSQLNVNLLKRRAKGPYRWWNHTLKTVIRSLNRRWTWSSDEAQSHTTSPNPYIKNATKEFIRPLFRHTKSIQNSFVTKEKPQNCDNFRKAKTSTYTS